MAWRPAVLGRPRVCTLERSPRCAVETARSQRAGAARAAGPLAVAVLPLQDYSPGAHQTSLADGVTEALIANLAQRGHLRVTSRTSSMAYKDSVKLLPDIARELGVDLVIEASIVRQDGRVRIIAQLIDASTDVHMWAHSYERPAAEILALQADLAAAVAEGVVGALSSTGVAAMR